MPLTPAKEETTPWLEPGAGLAAENARDDVTREQLEKAALLSIAITFKRVVDMAEPFVEIAMQELERTKKAKGK